MMHPIKWQVLPLGQINFLDCKIIKYNQERGSGATCSPTHNSNKPTSEDFPTKLDINELQILETNYIKEKDWIWHFQTCYSSSKAIPSLRFCEPEHFLL